MGNKTNVFYFAGNDNGTFLMKEVYNRVDGVEI